MLRQFLFAILSVLISAPSQAETAVSQDEFVSLFDRAVQTVPNLEALEKLSIQAGFRIVSKESTGSHLSYLEAANTDEDFYIVGIRDHRASLSADHVRLLVTQYGTDASYAKNLTSQAQQHLPQGPSHKSDLSGGFTFGTAWEAGYPDLITLEVKFHRKEKASLMEAVFLKTN
ncbi:hypothetical protein [Pseudophaeobacter leonis]|uniref:hypothetical protein n=1 Tax=Pseudophaeobacter leonis TaxID=1144477 RepID=UPI0009F4E0A4|nr:hypothetical protein [Pseudophaeobacter leonis]